MNKVPSITKTNHRYRGEMELDKHNLLIHQALHDIVELCYIFDCNDYNPDDRIPGHEDYITNHIKRTVGENVSIYAKHETLQDTSILGEIDFLPFEGEVNISDKVNDLLGRAENLYKNI